MLAFLVLLVFLLQDTLFHALLLAPLVAKQVRSLNLSALEAVLCQRLERSRDLALLPATRARELFLGLLVHVGENGWDTHLQRRGWVLARTMGTLRRARRADLEDVQRGVLEGVEVLAEGSLLALKVD